MVDEVREVKVPPKVFISYSWTTPEHQKLIREWADRLVGDGIDVIFDRYDLKEGQDKYVFMERMVADPTVSHVLVFSDAVYAQKADSRKAGVGTESQIISGEVYSSVEQSKFIPIVCEFDATGEPCLPTYMKARMWINFSTPEDANENWEQLVRLLHGKPLFKKPEIGQMPAYLRDEAHEPADFAGPKLVTLKQAILQGRKGISNYRRDFLDTCISFADQLRTRQARSNEAAGQQVLETYLSLKRVRNHLVDWVLLESDNEPAQQFEQFLIETLEQLLELKALPAEVTSYNEWWFDAHSVFVYEAFLYIVAALIKTNCDDVLAEVLSSHYLKPEASRRGSERFETVDSFYGRSEVLNEVLSKDQRYYSPAAELMRRQADRTDIPFTSVIEAEMLVMLRVLISDQYWYPGTLHYSKGTPRLFVRAMQKKHFLRLAKLVGVKDSEELKARVKGGDERLRTSWHNFNFRHLGESMGIEKMDTL